MNYNTQIFIQGREISLNSPTYFIADIAANHDGDLQRAKELIWLAKKAGADAAKFQHFKASRIVSDFGFKHLGGQLSHQSKWKKGVYEIYEQYECNRGWTEELAKTAKDANISFLTTPYDLEAVEMLDRYILAYKIGSGDITWTDFIEVVSKKNKPVLLATGASTMEDVERAVDVILARNPNIVLLQCNTNYTGSMENFQYVNLRVLSTYGIRFPQMLLGLSDHTPGHSTVLGAIALGARVIEKHFTDDNNREGPDHPFSMNPQSWRQMIERSRELELSLGTGVKRVERNEMDTVVVQQRCLRLTRHMKSGERLTTDDLEALRPAPAGSVKPYDLSKIIGATLKVSKVAGDALYQTDFMIERREM